MGPAQKAEAGVQSRVSRSREQTWMEEWGLSAQVCFAPVWSMLHLCRNHSGKLFQKQVPGL